VHQWRLCLLDNMQKLAIKRMNLQATKEFMAELQVLTHVHHTNLVRSQGDDFVCSWHSALENDCVYVIDGHKDLQRSGFWVHE
jgi:hypothetical protein